MRTDIEIGQSEISNSAEFALKQAGISLDALLADYRAGKFWQNSLIVHHAKARQLEGKPVSALRQLATGKTLRLVTVTDSYGKVRTLVGLSDERTVGNAVIFTEAEYLSYPADYKSTWSTERDDQPNWEAERHLFMGKRTVMMSCALNIEGLTLFII